MDTPKHSFVRKSRRKKRSDVSVVRRVDDTHARNSHACSQGKNTVLILLKTGSIVRNNTRQDRTRCDPQPSATGVHPLSTDLAQVAFVPL